MKVIADLIFVLKNSKKCYFVALDHNWTFGKNNLQWVVDLHE